MAEWKKVIVSGSSPELAAVTVDGTVTANAFSGDGSALTGVAAGSIDIDNFTAGTTLAQGDHFLYSDSGTELKITFSDLEDEVFGNVSGDVTIAAGGASTIANDAITAAKIDDDAVRTAAIADGQVTNAKLANDGITIAGNDTSLGGTITAATILSGTSVISGSAQITAAGALMDSEVTNLSDVKSFDPADYATAAQGTLADNALAASEVSAFGATLIDDADASAARTTLGVDAAGTDNSTDVTLANTNYLSITGQEITGGTVPVASGGTGATTAAGARTALGVDAAGTDNSTNVTLAGSRDYITISGQTITRNQIDISDDTNLAAGTGVTLTGDTLSIGQSVGTSDNVTFGNITATGDLTVQGTLTSLQTTNLNIEDQFILLNSGSQDAQSQGIIFGGSTGAQGAGEAFFYDLDADRPAWSSNAVAWNATSAAETAFIPRVFDVDGSAHSPIAEVGSIQISGGEVFIYG